MDLKSQIEIRKRSLRTTKTLLTNELGERYEIVQGVTRKLDEKSSPYVIDYKPDMQVGRVIDGLFISSQDPVAHLESLQLYAIGHVLSLGVEPSVKFPHVVTYHFVPLLDIPEFNIRQGIETSLKIIHDNIDENILVHCNAGVSRSATIVIAYLMASLGLNYDEAFAKVKSIRSCIRPNDGFVRQLKDLTCIEAILQALTDPKTLEKD